MNRNFLDDESGKSRSTKGTIFFVSYAVVLIVALLNMNATLSFVGWVFAILNPFIIGLAIAFLINIIMSRLESHVFRFLDKPRFKLWKRIKRGVCLFLSFLIILLLLTALLFFIVPHIRDSIMLLAKNIPSYANYLQSLTNTVLSRFGLTPADLGGFAINWNEIVDKIGGLLASVSPGVITFASGLSSAVFNFFMGIIFALYLLISKEKLLLQLKKLLYAFLPARKVEQIYEIGHLTNSTFTGFVVGQLTEAVILGTMYFIGTSIFRMPYAPLIATLMAICSLIPMFGPFIGAIPSAFILFMVNPNLAIGFVIMAIVFQQIEGNFIYPRVVGGSIGLPAIWVLFAILVGGSLAGGIGMILSVPVASVLYALMRRSVSRRLRNKNIDL